MCISYEFLFSRFCQRYRPILESFCCTLGHFPCDFKRNNDIDLEAFAATVASSQPSLQNLASIFQRDVRNLAKELDISASHIAWVDEVPLNFAPSAVSSDLEFEERQSCRAVSSLLKQSGFAESQAIVVLATFADGSLLAPLIVFKVSFHFSKKKIIEQS